MIDGRGASERSCMIINPITMFNSSSLTSTTCADSDTERAITAEKLETRSQPTPTISDTVIPTSLAVDTGFRGS
jgi:hypothetical protein